MRYISLLASVLLLSACDVAANDLSVGKLFTRDTGETQNTNEPEEALSETPNGKEQALVIAAQGAMANGDTTTAEHDLRNAVALSEGSVQAHLMLAELYLSQKKPTKAREILHRALKLQPRHAMINYQLGKLELTAGNGLAADQAFSAGLRSEPDDVDMLNGAGVAKDILRRHTAAQLLYLRAINQNPQQKLVRVRTNLAMSYMLSDEPQKAVDLLKDDATKPNASSVTRHNLALAYGMLGRNQEARALLGKDMTEADRNAALARLAVYHTTEAASSSAPAAAPTVSAPLPKTLPTKGPLVLPNETLILPEKTLGTLVHPTPAIAVEPKIEPKIMPNAVAVPPVVTAPVIVVPATATPPAAAPATAEKATVPAAKPKAASKKKTLKEPSKATSEVSAAAPAVKPSAAAASSTLPSTLPFEEPDSDTLKKDAPAPAK